MYQLVIVDDEEKIADGMRHLFPWESVGFAVSAQFTSALDALEYIENHPVDVVLSDINMPEMDGITFTQNLKKYPNLKVVLFSSYTHYEYFRNAIQHGVMDYLLKPIEYGALMECFQRVRNGLDAERRIEPQQPQDYYSTIVTQVKQYLSVHYQNANLDEAAMLVNLSPSYLSSIFKEKSGENFSDVLQGIRMKKAKELLANPNYKAYDIAFDLGYDNPKSFSRAFRNYYGISVSQFRKAETGGA